MFSRFFILFYLIYLILVFICSFSHSVQNLVSFGRLVGWLGRFSAIQIVVSISIAQTDTSARTIWKWWWWCRWWVYVDMYIRPIKIYLSMLPVQPQTSFDHCLCQSSGSVIKSREMQRGCYQCHYSLVCSLFRRITTQHTHYHTRASFIPFYLYYYYFFSLALSLSLSTSFCFVRYHQYIILYALYTFVRRKIQIQRKRKLWQEAMPEPNLRVFFSLSFILAIFPFTELKRQRQWWKAANETKRRD